MTQIRTAREIAALLNGVQFISPESIEYVGELIEIVGSINVTYPQLNELYQAFKNAYTQPSSFTEASWAELQRTAATMAGAFYAMGDTVFRLCQKPTLFTEACEMALAPDTGACPYEDAFNWHVG